MLRLLRLTSLVLVALIVFGLILVASSLTAPATLEFGVSKINLAPGEVATLTVQALGAPVNLRPLSVSTDTTCPAVYVLTGDTQGYCLKLENGSTLVWFTWQK